MINDEVRVYRKKQQVAQKQQQVAEKQQQVAIAEEATEHIGITIALIQLAMYIDYGIYPSADVNQMKKIMEYKTTSPEVKNLFSELLERKKKNDTFSWEKDGKRLMKLAESHLDKSIVLQKELSDARLSKTISEMIQNAQIGYRQTYDAISNKKR